MEINLNVGDRRNVTIADIAFGGEGVARIDNFVLFVPFVLPGEEVEVELTEVKKSFARAKLLQVLKPSPDRVTPECRYFGACGGCQYQHAAYSAQLRIKHKQIADIFERVGKVSPERVRPVEPCPQPYGYRNRLMVRSQWHKPEQRLVIGFLRHDNGLVVDLEECRIAEPALNEQILKVRANPPPRGGLKVALRIAPEGWEVPPDSFFQNNFFLLPRMVEVVRERMQEAGTRFLADIYCGVGFFSLELADAVEAYAGIEIDAMAVKAARKNALARQRTNGEFLRGPAEDLLPQVLGKFDARATTVILDPPRVGCHKGGLELLRQTRPAQVIYVSCHPATLARDISILTEGGLFRLERVTPLDMFPQTQHVECVADLRCVEPASGGVNEAEARPLEDAAL